MTPAVLVVDGCSQRKLARRCAAADLYSPSQLYRAARRYAEREGSAGWLIVSAKHGLVRPDTELDPYDERLPTRRDDLWTWRFRAQADFAGWLRDHPQYVTPGDGLTRPG